jgi:Ca-activated chloride channel family protein
MKKMMFGVCLTCCVALGVSVTFFGDCMRNHFGMSASALAGETSTERRVEHKRVKTFAKEFPDNGAGEVTFGAPSFVRLTPNGAVETRVDHLSTFAVDIDTASYTYARRTLQSHQRPEPASVRVEEWVNAFHYTLQAPSDAPFAAWADGAPSPFDPDTYVLKVALQGRRVANTDRKPAHLVFLVDTSGSMSGTDRLELAQRSLHVLVDHLNARDTVAIATYAGSTQVILEPTSAERRSTIHAAIDTLSTGGGTAMGSGMELAYSMAMKQVRRGEVSRVLVLTDGDANIGPNTTGQTILQSIKGYVDEGVTLTTVGFGMGNYRAAQLERLADMGNGQSLYIDSIAAAQKAFGTDLSSTIEQIARDVKVQVDFDPNVVETYKLLGYENRDVRDGHFRDDSVEGGALGAGHSVTAMYELKLRNEHDSLGVIHVRGLNPETRQPFEVATRIGRSAIATSLFAGSDDLRFATAVALAADTLRGNAHEAWPLARIIELAQFATRGDAARAEFVSLMRLAEDSAEVAHAQHRDADLFSAGY